MWGVGDMMCHHGIQTTLVLACRAVCELQVCCVAACVSPLSHTSMQQLRAATT